ncbi:MAG: FecR domain-containing protein [Phycisphaerae bacterium]|nr:FecR domain-containing protein [Phycisphaerae bacterium]
MTEKEFEQNLALYLEGDISDDDLVSLQKAIQETPAYGQRFREELRLHTLMREAATEQVAQKDLTPTCLPRVRTRWSRGLYAAAACLIAGGLLYGLIWFNLPKQQDAGFGVCLNVSGSEPVRIIRHGQTTIAQAGTVIFRGDMIASSQRSRATIELNEGTNLVLEEDSVVVVDQTPDAQTKIRLDAGHALFEVETRDPSVPPVLVQTADAMVEVFGTLFTLDAAPGNTQLKVYEGLVELRQINTGQAVQVGSEEYAETGSGPLKVGDLADRMLDVPPSVYVEIPASDDAYLDHNKGYNNSTLKVEGKRRTFYLKFNVHVTGQITGARLQLTQMIDPGSGTLHFLTGSDNTWSEDQLTPETAPKGLDECARYVGVVMPRQTIEVDVSNRVRGNATYTFVVTMDESLGHDIWFGSSESPFPPKLIVTYVHEDDPD